MDRPFLTARLSRLILLGYAIDPGLLLTHVPPGTELDFHNRQTFISLVGLTFNAPRVLGRRLPFYGGHVQVNLRFYVRRRLARHDWRHGVAFIKQIVPHRPLAWAGRWLFNEDMATQRMDQIHRSQGQGDFLTEYGWRAGRQRFFIRAVYSNQPVPPEPESAEEFLLARYWGYRVRRDGTCLEYQFSHPPWRICQAGPAGAAAEADDFFGQPFTKVLARPPDLWLATDGSEVALHRGRIF